MLIKNSRICALSCNCAGATEGGESMKIEVIHNFYDKENHLKLRKVGDKYSVSKERGKYLIALKVAKEIPEQKGGDSEFPAEA